MEFLQKDIELYFNDDSREPPEAEPARKKHKSDSSLSPPEESIVPSEEMQLVMDERDVLKERFSHFAKALVYLFNEKRRGAQS